MKWVIAKHGKGCIEWYSHSCRGYFQKKLDIFKHLYDHVYLIDVLVLMDNGEDDGEMIIEISNGKILIC
ncbi:hypothetical protein [Oceanobacillus senegalensis]|uniref:hypothetical protein n=1 Tax=Oceanobacillus senegalensis TaxID=1936063 RepID=UPI000A305FDA|nr:hypothetical protein [Oceanobacillus senegalensis]